MSKNQRWTRKKLLRIREEQTRSARKAAKLAQREAQDQDRSGRFADSAFKGVEL